MLLLKEFVDPFRNIIKILAGKYHSVVKADVISVVNLYNQKAQWLFTLAINTGQHSL